MAIKYSSYDTIVALAYKIREVVSNKANATHKHTKADITDFAHTHNYAAVNHTHSYAPVSHKHASADITISQATIDKFAAIGMK